VTEACAATYSNPAVQWLLGGELHPGGEPTTRRALELINLRPGDRLLDVASGTGTSAILAAREFGCIATGVEYSAEAVRVAQTAADVASLSHRIGFVAGDAEELPFPGGSFDAALVECSLSVFSDKELALAELHRVLRPGGRLAISDVTADHDRLPHSLREAMAQIACVGSALSQRDYEDLLTSAGFEVLTGEACDREAAAMAERVVDRLRGARVLGFGGVAQGRFGLDEAIELAFLAKEAIAEGSLGYAILSARR
jgi:ubiquinone/menaquinone biosynthesis C-methylase UbiE